MPRPLCARTTKAGKKCRNAVRAGGSTFCHLHADVPGSPEPPRRRAARKTVRFAPDVPAEQPLSRHLGGSLGAVCDQQAAGHTAHSAGVCPQERPWLHHPGGGRRATCVADRTRACLHRGETPYRESDPEARQARESHSTSREN